MSNNSRIVGGKLLGRKDDENQPSSSLRREGQKRKSRVIGGKYFTAGKTEEERRKDRFRRLLRSQREETQKIQEKYIDPLETTKEEFGQKHPVVKVLAGAGAGVTTWGAGIAATLPTLARIGIEAGREEKEGPGVELEKSIAGEDSKTRIENWFDSHLAGEALKKSKDFIDIMSEGQQEAMSTISDRNPAPSSLAEFSQILTSGGLSYLSSVGLTTVTGAPALAGSIMGVIESSSEYSRCKEAGYDSSHCRKVTAKSFGITALLESLGNAAILKDFGGSWLTKAALSGSSEMVTEDMQTVAQNMVRKDGYDETVKWHDGLLETTIGTIPAFFGGGAGTARQVLIQEQYIQQYQESTGATREEAETAFDNYRKMAERLRMANRKKFGRNIGLIWEDISKQQNIKGEVLDETLSNLKEKFLAKGETEIANKIDSLSFPERVSGIGHLEDLIKGHLTDSELDVASQEIKSEMDSLRQRADEVIEQQTLEEMIPSPKEVDKVDVTEEGLTEPEFGEKEAKNIPESIRRGLSPKETAKAVNAYFATIQRLEVARAGMKYDPTINLAPGEARRLGIPEGRIVLESTYPDWVGDKKGERRRGTIDKAIDYLRRGEEPRSNAVNIRAVMDNIREHIARKAGVPKEKIKNMNLDHIAHVMFKEEEVTPQPREEAEEAREEKRERVAEANENNPQVTKQYRRAERFIAEGRLREAEKTMHSLAPDDFELPGDYAAVIADLSDRINRARLEIVERRQERLDLRPRQREVQLGRWEDSLPVPPLEDPKLKEVIKITTEDGEIIPYRGAPNISNWHPESQEVILMTPSEFLEIVPDRKLNRDNVERIKQGLKNGNGLEPMFIDVRTDTGEVVSHEGRHRAKALQELGVGEVPVVKFHKDADLNYTEAPEGSADYGNFHTHQAYIQGRSRGLQRRQERLEYGPYYTEEQLAERRKRAKEEGIGPMDFSGLGETSVKDIGIKYQPELVKTGRQVEPMNEDFYARNRGLNEEKSFWEKTEEKVKEIIKGDWHKNITTGITTRLENISPKLFRGVRKFEFNVRKHTIEDMQKISDYLDKVKKMSSEDILDWDLALKNGDGDKLQSLSEKYDFGKAAEDFREVMDGIYERGAMVYEDFGYKKNYGPHIIEDFDGLMAELRDSEVWGPFGEAFHRISVRVNGGRPLTDAQRTEVVQRLFRGHKVEGVRLRKAGPTYERKIKQITPKLNKYFKPSHKALVEYIMQMNQRIEARRFFGEFVLKKHDIDPDDLGAYQLKDTIGYIVQQAHQEENLSPKQQREIKNMLEARFSRGGMSNIVRIYRQLAYLTILPQPRHALTQMTDIVWPTYTEGLPSAIKGAIKSLTNEGITKEEVYGDIIMSDLPTQGKLASYLDTAMQFSSFSAFDRIFGKEALINATLEGMYQRVNGDEEAQQRLRASLQRTLGREAGDAMQDLKDGVVTERIKLHLFNVLSDFHPITPSEMPAAYNRHPNSRVLYMFKSYTLKKFDTYRREIFNTMREDPKEGMKNLIRLAMLLWGSGFTIDVIKKILWGRKVDPGEIAVDNLWGLIGLSRYHARTVRQEGLGRAIVDEVAPPYRPISDLGKDLFDVVDAMRKYDESMSVNEFRTPQYLPVGGDLWYWWFGPGKRWKRKQKGMGGTTISTGGGKGETIGPKPPSFPEPPSPPEPPKPPTF